MPFAAPGHDSHVAFGIDSNLRAGENRAPPLSVLPDKVYAPLAIPANSICCINEGVELLASAG
jgi:hypothetical protein